MKKINIILAGLALFGGMALTACDQDQVLPPVTGAPTFLVNNMDGFTIEYATPLPSGVTDIWKWDDKYGAVASAYIGGSRYATDVYLVSPEITLTSEPQATFSQAVNYLSGNTATDFLNVCVREGQEGEWFPVAVSQWPVGNDWTFIDCSFDVSAYAGKTIQVGLHYQSTTSIAPTWEVKSLWVY